jgi:cytochrome c oxidase cbb3-type subunit III
MCGSKLALLVILLSVSLAGQHGSTNAVNPYTAPDDAAAGARLYRAQCAGCHGPDGAGTGAGPSLNSGTFRKGGSDEAVFHTISKGVPGSSMPAFSFSGLRTWQLVTHLRSLSIKHGASQMKGSAQAGRALFSASCSGCHTVAGKGGLSGPDLNDVGSRLSGVALRTALLDPNADVNSEYWSVAIRTISGRKLTGIRLNEDTHSIQIRDENGKLISVGRRDIAESELIRQSPMPAFAGKLTGEQIEDLLAYLVALRGNQ